MREASSVTLSEGTARDDAAELVETLREHGYLRIRCDDEVRQISHRVFAEAEAFFSLPLGIKSLSSLHPEMEGYRGYASEYCELEDRPDLCESFWTHAFNVTSARRSLHTSALPLYRAMTEAAERLDALVARLLLAVESHYFRSTRDRPQFGTRLGSHLQLNYYRPAEQKRSLLLDPHEDGLLFTLLQSTSPGLEIRTKDGSFQPVHTRPGELLVMPGEIAALLSGGDIEPLYHRVGTRSGVEKRMSLMYFSNPNASRTEKLEPWRETPFNRNVDIMRRVIENPLKFGLPPIPVVEDLA